MFNGMANNRTAWGLFMVNSGKMNIRESNFELLRIISMFMIVLLHMGTHGLSSYVNIPTFLAGKNGYLYDFIRSLSIVAVNLYILISGYFLSKSAFKLKKSLYIFGETGFFSALLYIICSWLGYTHFTSGSFFHFFFSVFLGDYWFVTVYFVLYCLSPYLNKLIDNLNKPEHLKLLLLLFLLTSVWQFFYPIINFGVVDGYGLISFLFLYILAAYIRKYHFILRDFNKNIYFILYLVLAVCNIFLVYKFSDRADMLFGYNSPVVLLMSYFLFQYFHHIKIKSKVINFVSKYVFGIYLIHEQPIVSQILWKKLRIIENILSTQKYFIMAKFVYFSIIVFISCWIGSLVLTAIFHFIFEICSKVISRATNVRRG